MCLILLRIVGKMRQSNYLQKTGCSFKMVIAVTFKQGVIIPQEKPFQLDQFQCQMVIHFEVVLFEITK